MNGQWFVSFKPNFSTGDLWDLADPPARLVYINKNGKPIDEKAETKLLHANIQIENRNAPT